MAKKTKLQETDMHSQEYFDAVRVQAEVLFEKSGRIPGRDKDNWFEAEGIVQSKKCCG